MYKIAFEREPCAVCCVCNAHNTYVRLPASSLLFTNSDRMRIERELYAHIEHAVTEKGENVRFDASVETTTAAMTTTMPIEVDCVIVCLSLYASATVCVCCVVRGLCVCVCCVYFVLYRVRTLSVTHIRL